MEVAVRLKQLYHVHGVHTITLTPDGAMSSAPSTPAIERIIAALRDDLARYADAQGVVLIPDVLRRFQQGDPPSSPPEPQSPPDPKPAQRLAARLRADPRLADWCITRCTDEGEPDRQGAYVLIVAPGGRWQFLAPALDLRLAEREARRFIAALLPELRADPRLADAPDARDP
ncbi:hypothetical protein [Roseiflexus sp.]